MDILKQQHQTKFHRDTLKLCRRMRRHPNKLRGRRNYRSIMQAAVTALLEKKIRHHYRMMRLNAFHI